MSNTELLTKRRKLKKDHLNHQEKEGTNGYNSQSLNTNMYM